VEALEPALLDAGPRVEAPQKFETGTPYEPGRCACRHLPQRLDAIVGPRMRRQEPSVAPPNACMSQVSVVVIISFGQPASAIRRRAGERCRRHLSFEADKLPDDLPQTRALSGP
jgi:hypothetical protein